MSYLLDTNILSDLVRNPHGRVAEHIREVGDVRICTSIIVASELRYGAAKRESPRLTRQLDAVLDVLDALPFEAPADITYGGQPIGGNDLLIAAQTLTLRYTLVTDNDGEFSRIDDLERENWLR